MLDVHAPEHRISGKKDFLVHMGTITLGLLIALGLENAVEAVHHHRERKEAETLIREEIKDNRQLILTGAPQLKKEIADMTSVLDALEIRSSGGKAPIDEKDLALFESPLQDAAWRTANSTGTVSYMNFTEVEKFAEAYKEQALLETTEEQALNDYLQLVPVLHGSGPISDADRAKAALPYARSAAGHLSGMYFIGAGTLNSYNEALK